MEILKEIERLKKMPLEELYEISRKKGIRNDISMDKDELINMILSYDIEEDAGITPEDNDFSAKNQNCEDEND